MKSIPFLFFTFVLIFAPLAFGTVEQWSIVILETVSGIGYVLFFLLAWLYREKAYRIPGVLPLFLLICLMTLQMIPLPAAIVKILSPGTFDVYSPVLSLSSETNWISLSVNKRATLHEMLRIISYAMMYVLTVQLLSRPSQLKSTINKVVLLASAIAFFAIIQDFSSPDKIFWLRQAPAHSSPYGPWINPNQFAGYIELICPLAFGLFLFYKPRVKSDESLKERFVSFFTVPGIHFHFFLGFGTVLMALAVFTSLCRGGILSIMIAIAVFLLMFRKKFPGRSRGAIFFIIFSIVIAISWFGWGIIVSEFTHGFDAVGKISDDRLTLWSDCLQIVKDFPLFGAGFGSFLYIYPLYKTIGNNLIYDHAHNDYLELLTDGGIVGLCLVAWFVFAVIFHCWKMIKVRRDRYAVLVGIGGLSGIVALLAHSVTDFNMHNGAVGLYFFFLCGATVASVNSRMSYRSSGTLLRKMNARFSIYLGSFGVVALLLIVVVQSGSFVAWNKYSEIEKIYVNKQLSRQKLQLIKKSVQQAEALDPLEGLFSYKLGTVQWYLGEKEDALSEHIQAVRKNPLEGAYLHQVGLLTEDEEQSKALLEMGYDRALNKKELVINYAEWLLWKGRRLEAINVLRDRLQQDYQEIFSWMPLLNGYSFSRSEISQIIPEKVSDWIRYGQYIEKNRSSKEAKYFFDKAYMLLQERNRQLAKKDTKSYKRIISYYQRNHFPDQALSVLRKAVEDNPDIATFHILLGEHYQREGIVYRAKEEFERALLLEPKNRKAHSKLRKLGYADSY